MKARCRPQSGKVRKQTHGEVCSWVNKAWNGVKPEVIIRCLKNRGISNAMYGTEEIAVFDQSDSPDDDIHDDYELAVIAKVLIPFDSSDESDDE